MELLEARKAHSREHGPLLPCAITWTGARTIELSLEQSNPSYTFTSARDAESIDRIWDTGHRFAKTAYTSRGYRSTMRSMSNHATAVPRCAPCDLCHTVSNLALLPDTLTANVRTCLHPALPDAVGGFFETTIPLTQGSLHQRAHQRAAGFLGWVSLPSDLVSVLPNPTVS